MKFLLCRIVFLRSLLVLGLVIHIPPKLTPMWTPCLPMNSLAEMNCYPWMHSLPLRIHIQRVSGSLLSSLTRGHPQRAGGPRPVDPSACPVGAVTSYPFAQPQRPT